MKSHILFSGAVCASLAVHLVFAGISTSEDLALTGGEMANDVALGSTFADLVKGTNTGVSASSDTMEPNKPTRASRPITKQVFKAPSALADTSATSPQHTAAPAPSAQTPLNGFEAAEPVLAKTATKPSQASKAAVTASATKIAAISPDMSLAALVQPEARRSATEPTQRDFSKQRPMLRPLPARVIEATPPRSPLKTVVKAQEPPAPSAARGNAKVSAAKGQSDGRQGAQAAESNQAKETKAKQAGSTQLRNYQTSVLRRISRARVTGIGTKAKVRVSLSIGVSGQLTNLRILKGSGNSRADQIALQKVQRAAPFSPPPDGNPVRFSVDVKIKG